MTAFFALVCLHGAEATCGDTPGLAHHDPQETVPDWAQDAIFYQVFPERFRNGDPSNDPTRESLEFPDVVPASWQVSPWTGDWYARASWEREMGEDFFNDGVFHRRYGGDLQGVLEKLDYLSDLGITAIYFNPVFYARSLHKYDGNSFHHVEPHFGPDPAGDLAIMAQETDDPQSWRWTAADRLFLELLRKARERGIRVIIDGVFNHTGRDFFAFKNLRELQRKSPYASWYMVDAYDDPSTPANEFRYRGWWGVDTLPEFANNEDSTDLHPGPKAYILAATRRWMDPDGDGDPTDGIDGWRLDVANEVPQRFWVDWHRFVRSINPQAYTVAEIWTDASRYLLECGFSATMNYHGFAFPVKGFLVDGSLSAGDFSRLLAERREEHHPRVQYAVQNLLDSHDTDRLASMIVNSRTGVYLRPDRYDYDVTERSTPRHFGDYDVSKPTDGDRRVQRLAALFQMTYVGAPMIYYGTEAGMWGADDPCDRMPMIWPDFQYDPQTADPLRRPRRPDTVAFDSSLHGFFRAAIRLRRHFASLRRGDIRVLLADDVTDVLAFLRTHHDGPLLVILNRSRLPRKVAVPLGDSAVEGQAWRQVFTSTGDAVELGAVTRSGRLEISLPPLFGAVLAPSSP